MALSTHDECVRVGSCPCRPSTTCSKEGEVRSSLRRCGRSQGAKKLAGLPTQSTLSEEFAVPLAAHPSHSRRLDSPLHFGDSIALLWELGDQGKVEAPEGLICMR